jgi:hypothetical protein
MSGVTIGKWGANFFNGHSIKHESSCTMRSFIFFTHPQILLGRSNQGEWGWRGMWNAWEMTEMRRRFWWESLKETTWKTTA